MGKINVGKVIVGGIVAGIVMNGLDYVINAIIMKNQLALAAAARNIDLSVVSVPTMVALDFAMGLMIVFTYACIRTRFGPGPKTAIVAGLIIAISTNILAAYFAGQGFFSWDLWAKMAGLEAGNTLISALAGCAVYTEA
jgi:hypothetical protein